MATYRYESYDKSIAPNQWGQFLEGDPSRFLIVFNNASGFWFTSRSSDASTFTGTGTQNLVTGDWTQTGTDTHTPNSLDTQLQGQFYVRPKGFTGFLDVFKLSILPHVPLVLTYKDWGPILGYEWEYFDPIGFRSITALIGTCDAPNAPK